MATLTESSVVARKVIRFGLIGFVGITLLWFLGGVVIKYYRILYPPPPPPPEVGFGKVPAINFPEEEGRPKLSLELPTGAVPAFPDRMAVYKAPTKRSTFGDDNWAIDAAVSLGFLFEPSQPTETYYVWTNQDALSSKLEMNIVSRYFELTRIWQNDPTLIGLAGFTSDKQAINQAMNILRKGNLLPDDVLKEPQVSYLKSLGGKMIRALSLSDADFIQIDFFRDNAEEVDEETKEVLSSYPFYRPEPARGLIRIIVSGNRETGKSIVYINYDYTDIQYVQKSNYSVKTGEEAWAELESGGGFVGLGSPVNGSIKIRRIFLGHYDGDEKRGYVMPVYIFLGDRDFVAYVSAVKDELIVGKEKTEKVTTK